MKVLGVSCYYHDAAAALVSDGRLVAAAEEERFTRAKHDSGFPENAIRFCLEYTDTKAEDLDCAIFYEKPLWKLDRTVSSAFRDWPKAAHTFSWAIPLWAKSRLRVARDVRKALQCRIPVYYSWHHLSHAASTFLTSPFERSAILTLDGVGEWSCGTWGIGSQNDIQLLGEMRFPNSVGLLYSTCTAYLGFEVNEGEWKVMGLSAYGKPTYLSSLHRLLSLHDDGSITLSPDAFVFTGKHHMYRGEVWQRIIGLPPRAPADPLEQEHCDFAASAQALFEQIVLLQAKHVKHCTGEEKPCLAGGGALNGVANWRLLRESGFTDIHIPPFPGDSGGAIGAALLVSHKLMPGLTREALRHAYYGPSFSNPEIEAMLRKCDITPHRLSDEELVEQVAALLAAGKIVGWFQGRGEIGPRALGNRTIFADPRRPQVKDTINAKVKFRESFRPFAPIVVDTEAERFFQIEGHRRFPFMNIVVPASKLGRSVIPASVHKDGTSRVQVLEEDVNPLAYKLLLRMRDKTGVPVLINTSFNVKGEPIVNTPADAWNTFLNSGLDAVALGNYLVHKNELSAPSRMSMTGGGDHVDY